MDKPAPTKSSAKVLIPGIDLVRFAAAFMVVFFHYGFFSWNEGVIPYGLRAVIGFDPGFPELTQVSWWGWVGVEVFFVISGFVIAISAEGRSAERFFRARLLRLMPALWFFASLAFIITLIYAALPVSEIVVLYLKSIVLWPRGSWLDGVYWTLVVEAVFYGVIFLLLFANRFHWLVPLTYVWGAISSLFWLICFIDLWHVLPASLSETVAHIRSAHFFKVMLLTTGSYFVVGLLLYLLYRRGLTARRLAMFAIVVLASEVGIYHTGKSMIAAYNIDSFAAMPAIIWTIALAAIIASIAWGRQTAAWMTPRTTRLVRNTGLATYPLYLFHGITGGFIFGHLLNTGLNKYVALLLAMALATTAAYLFAVNLEGRIRNAVASTYDRIAETITRLLATVPMTGANLQTILVSRQDKNR
jgi:peptidoglycan/LPS O-acetylase OafA/YrhL